MPKIAMPTTPTKPTKGKITRGGAKPAAARKLFTVGDLLNQINRVRPRLPERVRNALSDELDRLLDVSTAGEVANDAGEPQDSDIADLFIFVINRVVGLLKGKDTIKVVAFLRLLAEKWGFDELALEDNKNVHFVRVDAHFREIMGGLEIFPELKESQERTKQLKRQFKRGDRSGALGEALGDGLEVYARMRELPGLLIEAINELCQ